MKINKQMLSYPDDFDLKKTYQLLIDNQIPISLDGNIITFRSPVTIKTSDSADLFCKDALNICYLIPKTTPEELVCFQNLYTTTLATIIHVKLNADNVGIQSSYITHDNKIKSISSTKLYNGKTGIVVHTIFLADTGCGDDSNIGYFQIPQTETDNGDKLIDSVQSDIDMSFRNLRNQITTTSLLLGEK